MASAYNDRISSARNASRDINVIPGLRATSGLQGTIDAAVTLTEADSGGVFLVAKTGVYTISLPAPKQGLRFKFMVADTGTNVVTIAAPSTNISGSTSQGAVTTNTSGSTNVLLTSGQAAGDWVELEGISSALYLLSGSAATASDIDFS